MVRPRRPAQRRDLEAFDTSTIIQGNTVPVRLTGWLPSTQPIREARLYLEEATLARQSCPFLRILVRAARTEPEGRAGRRHVGLFRFQTIPCTASYLNPILSR